MNENPELKALLVKKHKSYFNRCLKILPAQVQSEEPNKLGIIYFCLHGLDLIDQLNLSEQEKKQHAEFIYKHKVDNPDTGVQAFRGSMTYSLPEKGDGSYDLPTLSATFFALVNLLILESDYSQHIDRHKIMLYVRQLQVKDGKNKGSIKTTLDTHGDPFGDTDLRYCYIAACIRTLLKYDELPESERVNDIDTVALENYVLDKINYNGGFSSTAYSESHSGLTFCGIACLGLLNYEFAGKSWTESTKSWLVHRQVSLNSEVEKDFYEDVDIGGFNGRDNKFADTCYSWWVTSSLRIIDPKGLGMLHLPLAARYLLNETQNSILGGFGKDPDTFPDPIHSYLAIASLSLWKSQKSLEYQGEHCLKNIDKKLVISETAKSFLDTNIIFHT